MRIDHRTPADITESVLFVGVQSSNKMECDFVPVSSFWSEHEDVEESRTGAPMKTRQRSPRITEKHCEALLDRWVTQEEVLKNGFVSRSSILG